MKIICFGDSNTYGYDPGFIFGGRYDHPWPSIIQDQTGWEMINLGLNGRQIPSGDLEISMMFNQLDRLLPADLLILLLGSNDIMQHSTSRARLLVRSRMTNLLQLLNEHYPDLRILLLAPSEVADMPEELIEISRELTPTYLHMAKVFNTDFASLYTWGIEVGADGLHLTEDAHHVAAAHIQEKIEEIIKKGRAD